jgi:hypothetical protein
LIRICFSMRSVDVFMRNLLVALLAGMPKTQPVYCI